MNALLKQLKSYKKDTILCMVYAALEVAMEVSIPIIAAIILDQGFGGRNMAVVYNYGFLMIALAFLSLFFGVQAGRYASSSAAGLSYNLREAIYEKIQTFGFSNIDKFSTAGLVTRMTTDVTNIQNAFIGGIRPIIRSPLMLIAGMGLSFYINPKIGTIFLIGIVLLFLVLSVIVKRTIPTFRQVFSEYDGINANVQENISGIRVVKAYVREDFEKEKFSKGVTRLFKLSKKAESLLALNNPCMMLVVFACIIAVSWFGANYIVAGQMTTGQLSSLFTYISMIMTSLMMLSMVVVMSSMATASINRVSTVLSETPDIKNPENPVTVVDNGQIDFNNVDFSYKKDSDKPVLNHINLHIKAGETIGIIGATGSGKTSLINLVSRLYDVTQGAVFVGGKNVKDYDLASLREQVSVVLQKNVLFSGTILENLRWGNENSTLEECEQAARIACADEFIHPLAKGYDSYVERGGANFSGGQRQRLCIARALLKKPKILILDDSTSAVDTSTDAKIRTALKKDLPETTKIIIAQRITSIQEADRVAIIDRGKVVAFDRPEALLLDNDIYKELYETQMTSGDFDEMEVSA
ncbi:ABC transporter ATP-binding protein [Enterococcus gilvus]|uniref:ABC transporter ATP-binding protein n=1 Tax=Enterococcus gilvus TaxID=160453 RepID=UPI003D6B119F